MTLHSSFKLIAMALLTACTTHGALDGVPGRIIKSKTKINSRKATPGWFYQGETVFFDCTSSRKDDPIDLLASNVVVYLDLCAATNAHQVYITKQGTVTGSNTCEFLLSAASSNTVLDPGYYQGLAKAMSLQGTNLVDLGLLTHYSLEVKALTDSRFTEVAGPKTYPMATDISNALHAVDLTLNSAITDLNSGLSAETSARTNADAALQVNMASNTTAIASETDARTNAVAALQANIDAEASSRTNAQATIQSNINSNATAIASETDARTNDVATLQTVISSNVANITAETAARTNADAALQLSMASNTTAIANETTARTNAVAALQANIDAEASSRTNAQVALQTEISNNTTAIASETDARTNAVANLQDQLDTLEVLAPDIIALGGSYYSDWFSLDLNPWPYHISHYGSTQAYNSVYASPDLVNSADGFLLGPNILRQSTWTNVEYQAVTNCTIISTITTNYNHGGGPTTKEASAVIWDAALPLGSTGIFSAGLNNYVRRTEMIYAGETNLYTNWVYQGDVPGSLRAFINTSMWARAQISGLETNVYLPDTWTRNTNCWTYGIDITCASPWNSDNSTCKAGTLITPQHFLYATHYRAAIGTEFLFVDNTNGLHYRTLVDQACLDPDCDWIHNDCTVGLLNEPLPPSIQSAQLLALTAANRLVGRVGLSGTIGLYALRLNRTENIYLSDVMIDHDDWTSRWLLPLRLGSYAYSGTVVSADSGNPSLLIIGTNTVLYSTQTGYTCGANLMRDATLIEQRINEMGHSIYTNLTYVNLAAWPDYNMPPIPN